MSGQFHIMIGHDVRTFHEHQVIVHPQNLLIYIVKRLEIATDTVTNVAKISSLATKNSGLVQSTADNTSTLTGYHNGDYFSLC